MTSPQEVMKLLGSKFFWCRFIKKDGTERVGTFLIGVGRKEASLNDGKHLIVWDTQLGEYRKIALSRIQELRARGVVIKKNRYGKFTARRRDG